MGEEKLWKTVLKQIKKQIGRAYFKTLFKDINLVSLSDQQIILSVSHDYQREQIEKKYSSLLSDIFDQITQRKNRLKIVIRTNQVKNKRSYGPLFAQETRQPPAPQLPPGLNPRHSFATFVVGNSNNVAFAAAQAAVSKPGIIYNPLFIYGGVGVGKTHLMQAVGNAYFQQEPRKKILYFPAEKFTNDLIDSLRSHTQKEFRSHYRRADLLLVDDIQFIGGKEGTQEEFFHTFNELYIANKQIVITSDRTPEEIPDLEERLISRFKGGLTVDIQLPDYEMRVAILKARCLEKNIALSQNLIELIAEKVNTNTRELEGTLTSMYSSSLAQKKTVDEKFINDFLGLKKKEKNKKISPKHLVSLVAKHFNITVQQITGKSRRTEYVVPRQIAMYLLRKEFSTKFQATGGLLGGRDHSTIVHGVQKVIHKMSTNNAFKQEVLGIKRQIC